MVTHLSIVYADATYDAPWSKQLEAHLQRRTQANDFDNDVRSPTVGQFFDPLVQSFAIRLEVPWFCA